MRAAIAGATAAVLAGVLSPAADACTRLPAPSGARVGIIASKPNQNPQRSVLRVCAGGRAVVLRRATLRLRDFRPTRGTLIGAASAAGRRVAWVETRFAGRARTITLTLVSVGRRVRTLRRFTLRRERSIFTPGVGVVLTRQGDLAWTAGTYSDTGVVMVEQPGRRRRMLARDTGFGLALEDGRTLRWSGADELLQFFDLRRRPCPGRARYKPFVRSDRVILTRAIYGAWFDGTTVVRGCDPATGRDRVLTQQYSTFSLTGYLTLVGIDRTWALFLHEEVDRDGCVQPSISVADVVSGRHAEAYLPHGCEGGLPSAAAGFAITDTAVAAWVAQGALWAAVGGKVVELDRGGTIAGLHAEGDAVVWTHDGSPRRVVP